MNKQEQQKERQNKSINSVEAYSAKFIQAVDKQLTAYPQIGAVVLEGLAVACTRVSEFLEGFREQLEERCDELKTSSANNKREKQTRTTPYKSPAKSQTTQSASAH